MGGTVGRGHAGFAPALRQAITRRGLSLERLRRRLDDLGVQVSVATLSYWQSGRSEPGRRSSLVAVPALEKVLGLAPGELGAQLTHRTAEAGPDAGPSMELPDLIDGRASMSDLRHDDARLRDQLEIVSEHCSVDVGSDGCLGSRWVRRVLVGTVAGADRFLVTRASTTETATASDSESSSTSSCPAVEPLLHCEQGRTHVSDDGTLVAHELLLDRSLDPGESIIVEYRLGGFRGARSYETARRASLRELVLEVRFDPGHLPDRVEMVHADLDGSGEVVGPVRPDSTGCVRMIRHHLPPGRYGVRWA